MKILVALLAAVATATAQEAPKIPRVPPAGIEVPAADRAEIEAGVKQLGDAIALLKKNPKFVDEIPNVEIFHKSADWALRYNEVFDVKQIATAKDHIKQGLARAAALAKGETPWNTQTGLVARGYRSKIDGSVQPYGVLIPDDFKPGEAKPRRLDFWCHGRGEKLSELSFIEGAQRSKGEFTPPGAIVCYLYGRYCCANKFAGETDLFEAFDDIKKHYPIDERRLVIRGFSMGGASTWQFATHFPGMWAAAAPGAGFAETAEFFKVFAPGKEAPPAWEQKLWRWYDCTTMAANLANTSVVAYSGEIDGQKQAADIMVKYAAQEGITFPHIIGPQTAHKYHPDSKPEINKLVDAAVAKGNEEFPRKVRFTTYSLIYSRTDTVWIRLMEKSWERADLNYDLSEDGKLTIQTKNVRHFSIKGGKARKIPIKTVTVDGQNVPAPEADGPVSLAKHNGKWMQFSEIPVKDRPSALLGKQDGLCGPVDHAFMSRFIFVRPTGKPLNEKIGEWTKAEMQRAIVQWRQVFRGDVEVMDDIKWLAEANRDTRRKANAVLWGDPSSNAVIRQYLNPTPKKDAFGVSELAFAMPIKWTATALELGTQKVDATNHVPIMIYPNPDYPSRYVVLNSGPTFREAAATNNSDQTPKLPDWAVVDLRTPPGPKWPGQIVDAGFFDENWK